MTKVVIDLERTRYLQCGLGQYSLHLGRAVLAAAGTEFEPILLLPPGATRLFPTGKCRTITASAWRKDMFTAWFRPLVSRWPGRPSADVWHVTHQDSKFWPIDQRVPVILTIHDLNFLREKPPQAIRRRLARLRRKVARATVVTTGSEYAAGEIREYLPLAGKQIRVIPHGVCLDQDTPPERPARLGPLGGDSTVPFLFTIGDITPKKNFHVLVEMLSQLRGYHLVVAGSKTTDYAAAIERRAAELGVADRVWLPGRVSEGERQWLYRHCAAFVFPSLTEGFGLPLIEAMSQGRPTFSSSKTSLPEVGGPLAFYWDQFDPRSMAAVLTQGLAVFHADADYGRKQRAWVSRFQWPRAARQYLALYREFAGRQRAAA